MERRGEERRSFPPFAFFPFSITQSALHEAELTLTLFYIEAFHLKTSQNPAYLMVLVFEHGARFFTNPLHTDV